MDFVCIPYRFTKAVLQALLYQVHSKMSNIDTNPFTFEFVGNNYSSTTATKWVKNHVTFVGTRSNYTFQESFRLLRGIPQPFLGLRVDCMYVCPCVMYGLAFLF